MDLVLAQIWSRCLYGVTTPVRPLEVRIGEPCPLLDDLLPVPVQTWAILTAHNPGGAPAEAPENHAAEARLDDELRQRGLATWPSSGGRDPDQPGAWTPESSRFLLGVSLADAHELARSYGQVAFVFGCRGGVTALVEVAPAGCRAGRRIETVAWVHGNGAAQTLMVRPHGQELWFMPGGKKEPGEDDVTALARELEEELAVRLRRDTVRALFVVEALAWGRPDTVVRMACYSAAVDGEPRASGEVEALRWIARDERALVPPAGALVLDRLAATMRDDDVSSDRATASQGASRGGRILGR